MTYGLKIFKPDYAALESAAAVAYANSSTNIKNVIDSNWANITTQYASKKASVVYAFKITATSPGVPTEEEITYWMTVGLGYNNKTFTDTYNSQYYNGTPSLTSAQVQAQIAARRASLNVKLPYPFYQNAGDSGTGSLSTKDVYGNNKTVLHLGLSDNLKWSSSSDYYTMYGLGTNTITNYGLQPAPTVAAPSMLGMVNFSPTTYNSTTVVPSNPSNWNFYNDFTIEFYLYPISGSTSGTDQKILSYTQDGVTLWSVYYRVNSSVIMNVPSTYIEDWQGPNNTYLYTNQLYHIAISYYNSGNGWVMGTFVNGVAGNRYQFNGLQSTNNSSLPAQLTIGGDGAYKFNGYIGALRVVCGTAVYKGNFTPAVKYTPFNKLDVLTAWYSIPKAQVVPNEQELQYWMVNGVGSGVPVPVYSSTDVTWNQVYNGYWPKSSTFDKTFTSCVGRTIKVIQTLIDAPSIETSYTVGASTTNSSTGNVQIAPSSVDTYLTILMK